MEEVSKPGFTMPIIWAVLAIVFCSLSCAGIGMGALGSESDMVDALNYASFPLCFFASAGLGGMIIHFAVPRPSAIRTVGPIGCGCGGGILGVMLVVTFFAAIWPSL